MSNNIKNLIFLGIFMFGFFGIHGYVNAEPADYYFSPNYNAYSTYGGDSNLIYPNNYSLSNSYNYNNYSNQGYSVDRYTSNRYDSGVYNQYPDYNQTQNSPTQVVYASDTKIATPSIYIPQIKSNTSTSTKSSTNTKSSTSSKTNTTNNSSDTTNISTQNGVANVSGEGVGIEDDRNGLVALSLYGTDQFLPDTILEWILVFFLILIIIILVRLVTKKRHHQN